MKLCLRVPVIGVAAGCLLAPLSTASAITAPTDPPQTLVLASGNTGVAQSARVDMVSDSWLLFSTPAGTFGQATTGGPAQPIAAAGRATLSGSMVVSPNSLSRAADWTDLATGENGTRAIDTNFYIAATPTGWLMNAGPTGAEIIDARTGAATQLATPPGNPVTHRYGQLIGPAGVLLSLQDSSRRYVAYADPATDVSLDIPAGSSCATLTATVLGCANARLGLIYRVPLNGGPHRTVAAAKVTTYWVADALTGWTDGNGLLHTVNLDGTNAQTSRSPRPGHGNRTAYYFVTGNTLATTGIYSVTSAASTPTQLLVFEPVPVAAAMIAVGPGRVAWSDNSSRIGSVWSRSLPGNGTAGAPSLLSSSATGDGLSVSGGRTTFGGVHGFRLATAGTSVQFVGPSQTVRNVTLSGTRVSYQQLTTNGYTLRVVDVSSRKTLFAATDTYASDLWGNYLAFSKTDGSVWRKDLGTGSLVKLRNASASTYTWRVSVWGDFVGWTANSKVGSRSALRNARYLTRPVVALPVDYTLWTLTNRGVIVAAPSGATQVRAYTSSTYTTVLTQPTRLVDFQSLGVEIDGDHMAWIGFDGLPKVTTLPHRANRPRFLGNGHAPTTSNTSLRPWAAELATSAPLTRCRVLVTSGATLIRSLACDAALMNVGVAGVSWDGTNSAGRRVTGALTWKLVAGNADGGVLAADGTTTPIRGTLTAK
ncbi:MAG: FlgD Ig-like protein [Frankiales bacterium]|nr:FlgD Ig-like protein [Frankiales bacterium]